MQRLEVSGAVRPIYRSLDVKRLKYLFCCRSTLLPGAATTLALPLPPPPPSYIPVLGSCFWEMVKCTYELHCRCIVPILPACNTHLHSVIAQQYVTPQFPARARACRRAPWSTSKTFLQAGQVCTTFKGHNLKIPYRCGSYDAVKSFL